MGFDWVDGTPSQEQTEEGPKPPAFPPPKADMAQPVGLAGHPWKVLDREIWKTGGWDKFENPIFCRDWDVFR